MKLRLLLLGCIVGLCTSAWAQEVDVVSVLADTKTFIFDNNKNTVKGYIYAQLEGNTSCCGEDRIYLEVKIDPSGYVISAKPLTGKNDCMKQSAVNIVKNIKWDAADFKGPKSVYFEIKPNIACRDGLDNTYAEMEIFNNPLLNPDGSRATTASGAEVTADGSVQEADTSQMASLMKAVGTADDDVPRANPDDEPAIAAANDNRGKKEETEPAEEKFVTTEPTPATPVQKDPLAEPRPQFAMADDGSSRGDDDDPALAGDRAKSAAEEIARQKEIDKLRRELDVMRRQEERRRQQLEERKRLQEEKERIMQERQDQQGNDGFGGDDDFGGDDGGSDEGGDGDMGGLFLSGGDDAESYGDGGEYGDEGGNGQEEMLLGEIEQLRQQQEDARQRLYQLEEEQMRIADENIQANEEIIRLEEEIAIKEEEVEQTREDEEIRRMEEERIAAAEERQQQDEEYQRMMDEIRRLQEEAEAQIAELEAKKADINRMEELAKARQQEIALERALRDQQRQKRMLDLRQQLGSGEGVPASSIIAGGSEADIADLMAQIDLSAEADSEAIKLLIEQINLMSGELDALRRKIRVLEGGSSTAPVRGGAITIGGQTTPPTGGNKGKQSGKTAKDSGTSGGVKSAATDDSWRNIDIKAPDVPDAEYGNAARPKATSNQGTPRGETGSSGYTADGGVPTSGGNGAPSQTPRFDDTRGYSSLADDNHENVEGPKGEERQYIDGRDAMKELITKRLQAGDICGLAQSVFSVTLDPQGNVKRHDILQVKGSDAIEIEQQLMTIIPTLRFTKADIRINQTIYIEFRAEIVCEGEQQIDLQSVEPLIKTN